MANIIRILIKKTSPTTPCLRFFSTTLKAPLLPCPTPTQTLIPNITRPDFANKPTTLLNPAPIHDVKPLKFWYPNFPFGFCLNPISISGFDQVRATEDDADDARTLWADSVKKKRKKKMNKHKYQKLRKRLRRKAS